jgi:XTP/dITP diphosphohydrolase
LRRTSNREVYNNTGISNYNEKMKIVFATNNKNKLKEIREILGSSFEIVSLSDIGCHTDIPETGNTLEENARQKSEYIMTNYRIDCFADDTGLEVEALDNAPGVHSARYAEGTDHNSEANMAKLLRELKGKKNRKARFRTVISLLEVSSKNPFDYREIQFEGEVKGHIATEKHGTAGFGYDPIFIPEGYDKSFAELGEKIKNQISHRAKAVKKLAEYLKASKK